MNNSKNPGRLIRLQEVMDLTGCKRAKLYQLVAKGEFPRPVKIGACAHWPENQVTAWINDRIELAQVGR